MAHDVDELKTRRSYACGVATVSKLPRRRPDEVRSALLRAAAELFAVKGYGGTSTKEIATAALTSETTIYRQFGSKADLFSAAVLEPFSAFLADYQDFFRQCMAEDSWTDQYITEKSVERLYHHLRENRNSVLAMVSVHADPEAGEPATEATRQLDEFFEALHAIGMERWQRDPSGFEARRLRLVHRFLIALILSVTALDKWFIPTGPHQPTSDELVHAITDFVLRGLVDNPHGAPATGGTLPHQLRQLADLHAAGALTDDEFSAAKTKLLQ